MLVRKKTDGRPGQPPKLKELRPTASHKKDARHGTRQPATLVIPEPYSPTTGVPSQARHARSPASPTSPNRAQQGRKHVLSPLARSAVGSGVVSDKGGGASTGNVLLKAVHLAAMQGDKDTLTAALRKNPSHVHAKDAHGKTPLLLAVEAGNYSLIKLLLSWGASASTRDEALMSVLHYAARQGHPRSLDLFLRPPISLPSAATDGSGLAPLHHAAYAGSLECVRLLLTRGAAVNLRSEKHLTPLLIAAALGHHDVVDCLLRQGAAVETVDLQGMTALHLAAAGGHTSVCERLLQGGCKADTQNNRKQRPLLLAALRGSAPVVQLLLTKGKADPNAVDDYQVTPLRGAALMGNEHVVKVLLELGNVSPDQADDHLDTALHLASRDGHAEVVHCLLERDADAEARNAGGETPLITAAASGQLPVVRLLVEMGRVNVEATTKDGRSALAVAAERGHGGVVAYLIEAGAKADAVDEHGCSALYEACGRGDSVIAAILLQGGADGKARNRTSQLSCLQIAALRGHMGIVRELLKFKPEVDGRDGVSGSTALYLAIKEGQKDTALVLLREGSASLTALSELGRPPLFACAMAPGDTGVSILEALLRHSPYLDLDAQDKHGYTVLHVAVERGNVAMLTHLCVGFCPIPDKSRGLNLVDANTAMFTDTVMGHSSGYRRGVDVNARERLDGWTPLHLLCTMHQHPDQAGLNSMAEALLRHGADVTLADMGQRRPLHIAAFSGLASVASALLQYNAEVNDRDRRGCTPLLLACQRNREPVVELLLRQRGVIDVNAEERDTGMTALLYAARNGHATVARALAQRGAKLEATDALGRNALAHATEAGHEALAEALAALMKEQGLSVPPPDKPTRPLHKAVVSNVATDVDDVLNANIANVEDRDARMRTALHLSAILGADAACGALLRHGADPKAKDLEGSTAMRLAARRGKAAVVKLLLQAGAQGEAGQEEHVQCVQAAACNGHEAVVRCFLDHAASQGTQALASLLQNDHPTRSLFVLAMDNGQDAVMKAVAERQGGID